MNALGGRGMCPSFFLRLAWDRSGVNEASPAPSVLGEDGKESSESERGDVEHVEEGVAQAWNIVLEPSSGYKSVRLSSWNMSSSNHFEQVSKNARVDPQRQLGGKHTY